MAGSERSRDHLSYGRAVLAWLQVALRCTLSEYRILPHGAAFRWISSCFGGLLGSYNYVAPLGAHAFPLSHCGKGECMGVHCVHMQTG